MNEVKEKYMKALGFMLQALKHIRRARICVEQAYNALPALDKPKFSRDVYEPLGKISQSLKKWSS